MAQADIFYERFDGEHIAIETDEVASAAARISNNGNWLVFSRTESSRPEVYVMPFPEGGSRKRVSTAGGYNAKWSANDDALYFVSYDRLMRVAISFAPDGDIVIDSPTEVLTFSNDADIRKNPYDLDHQGRIAIVDIVYGETPPLIYVSNWTEAFLGE